MQILKKHWIKLAVILLYFALIYFILKIYNIDYTKIKDVDPNFIRGKISLLGAWVYISYVLFYILRPLVLFPATLLSILGGVIFGYFWGIIFVLLGAMLSAVVEFLISRRFGRKLVTGLLSEEGLIRLDKTAQKHGFKAVLLIRLIPNVAYDIQNFSLGLSGIKFRDYFFATLLGIIPANLIYVYLGHSFLGLKYLWRVALVLCGLAILYFFTKKLINLNKIKWL